MSSMKEKDLMASRLERADLLNRLRVARNLDGFCSDIEQKYDQQQTQCDQLDKKLQRRGNISETVCSQVSLLNSSVSALSGLTAKLEDASMVSHSRQIEKFESLSERAMSQISQIEDQLNRLADDNLLNDFSLKLDNARDSKMETLNELVAAKKSTEKALLIEKDLGESKQQEQTTVSDELAVLISRKGEFEQKIRIVEDNIAELSDNSERLEGVTLKLRRQCNDIEREVECATTDEVFFLNEQAQQHSLELAGYQEKIEEANMDLQVATDASVKLSKQLEPDWLEGNVSTGDVRLRASVISQLHSLVASDTHDLSEMMMELTGCPNFIEVIPENIEKQLEEVKESSLISDLTKRESELQNDLWELRNKTLQVSNRIAKDEKLVLQKVSELASVRDSLAKKKAATRKYLNNIENDVSSLELIMNRREKELEELNNKLTQLTREGENYNLATPVKASIPLHSPLKRRARTNDTDDEQVTASSHEVDGISAFSPGALKRKTRQSTAAAKLIRRYSSGKEVVPSSQEGNFSDLFRKNDDDGGRAIVPDSAISQSTKGVQGFPHNMFLNDSMTEFSRPSSYAAIVSNLGAEDNDDEDSLMNSMISEQSVW